MDAKSKKFHGGWSRWDDREGARQKSSGTRYSAWFDHTPPERTVHGVPALAGQMQLRPGSLNSSSGLKGATPCRLKPGLHALCKAHSGCRITRLLVPL